MIGTHTHRMSNPLSAYARGVSHACDLYATVNTKDDTTLLPSGYLVRFGDKARIQGDHAEIESLYRLLEAQGSDGDSFWMDYSGPLIARFDAPPMF